MKFCVCVCVWDCLVNWKSKWWLPQYFYICFEKWWRERGEERENQALPCSCSRRSCLEQLTQSPASADRSSFQVFPVGDSTLLSELFIVASEENSWIQEPWYRTWAPEVTSQMGSAVPFLALAKNPCSVTQVLKCFCMYFKFLLVSVSIRLNSKMVSCYVALPEFDPWFWLQTTASC